MTIKILNKLVSLESDPEDTGPLIAYNYYICTCIYEKDGKEFTTTWDKPPVDQFIPTEDVTDQMIVEWILKDESN